MTEHKKGENIFAEKSKSFAECGLPGLSLLGCMGGADWAPLTHNTKRCWLFFLVGTTLFPETVELKVLNRTCKGLLKHLCVKNAAFYRAPKRWRGLRGSRLPRMKSPPGSSVPNRVQEDPWQSWWEDFLIQGAFVLKMDFWRWVIPQQRDRIVPGRAAIR